MIHPNSLKNLKLGSKRKYNINDNFLSNESEYKEDEAYFLGWMYSDGNLMNRYKQRYAKFAIAERDIEILEILKKITSFDGPINKIYRKPESIFGKPIKKYQDRVQIVLHSPKLIPKLSELKLDKRKSTETGFPFYLKKEYWNHFILGLFEGDGAFSFCESTGKSELNLVVNPVLAKDIEKILLQELHIQVYYANKKFENGAVILRFAGNRNMLKFFIWLYKNNKYKLNRKFQVFKKIIDYIDSLKTNRSVAKQFIEESRFIYNKYNV